LVQLGLNDSTQKKRKRKGGNNKGKKYRRLGIIV